MIEIRKLSDSDDEEADHIWLETFQAGTFSQLVPLREGREAYRDRITRFGLWDGSRMQAGYQMFDNRMHYGQGLTLPTAYISSVAVRPAARGRGYGTEVLRYMLGHMRESGQVFVTLVPFSFDYYRRLGWDWMSVTRTYRAATRVLPVGPPSDRVRAANQADFPSIEAMYARFARQFRGMSVRDNAEWNSVLGDTSSQVTYSYLYEGDGGVEGYLAFSGGSGEELSLTEFLTMSFQAQRALLELLRRFHMQTKFIVWDAPENDGLWSHVFDRQIETKLHPTCIGRLVDVAAALGALRAGEGVRETLTLEIHDPLLSWNAQALCIEVEGGVVSSKPTAKKPGIRMDVQAFSQAYMGVLSLAELRSRDRINVVEEPAFQALSRLLDGPPMWACGPI